LHFIFHALKFLVARTQKSTLCMQALFPATVFSWS